MAITGNDRGTGGNNSGATSITITPGSNLTAGSRAILVLAYDNQGTNGADPFSSISDSHGNTWATDSPALYDPAGAGAGVALRIFSSSMSAGTLTTGSTITVSFGAISVTAKAWTLSELIPTSGYALSFSAAGAGTGAATGTPTVTSSSLVSGTAIIGAGGAERADAWTGDADSSNGTWSTKQSTGFGTGNNGITVISQRKIVTGTGTQTYDPTTTSADCILCWASYTEAASSQSLSPTGIASTADIGSPTLTPGDVSILATGIASTSALGSPTLTQPAVDQDLFPTGIASTSALGSPTLAPGDVTILATGIASTAALGSPTLAPGDVTILATGIASTAALGSPTLTPGDVTILATGIASTAALGSPTLTQPAGDQDLFPTGIASTAAIGSPTLSVGDVSILATGIASTSALGSPTLTVGDVSILATGIASTLAFGSPVISAGESYILPTGIASTLDFGSPTIITGDVTILATGIASTAALGSPTLTQTGTDQNISPTGIASTLAFGSPTFSQYLSIYPKGIQSTLRFGSLTALYVPKPDAPPIEVKEVEFTESALVLTVKEIYKGKPNFDLLQKLANHLKIEVREDAVPGPVRVTREGFVADASGDYVIKETGSGLTIGLFKSVDGVLKPMSPGFAGEIRLIRGSKNVEMVPPAGWELVRDADIVNRFSIGQSPNFIVGVIRYVGL